MIAPVVEHSLLRHFHYPGEDFYGLAISTSLCWNTCPPCVLVHDRVHQYIRYIDGRFGHLQLYTYPGILR